MIVPLNHPTAGTHVHMIGIGGVGMSALAYLLSEAGMNVTGSDIRDSEILQALRRANIQTFVGHATHHVQRASTVIVSPAVPFSNPELLTARRRGIRVLSRAQALAEFVQDRLRVCITGSHGKTTTAAMLAFVCERSGLNPGCMIGGFSDCLQTNAAVGLGPFIMEACEAFGALESWQADHCIITNLDDEHSNHYRDYQGLKSAFRNFVERVPPTGSTVVCGDDVGIQQLCGETSRPFITYGLSDKSEFWAGIEAEDGAGSTATIWHKGNRVGRMVLPVPGRHNVVNALAALAMACRLGIDPAQTLSVLRDFQGVKRRCQLIAMVSDIRIYDDYAHHPTEIQAALAVARNAVLEGGRVLVAFEGLLHSRVRLLAPAFAAALANADFIALLPVDGAGEVGVEVSDDRLADALTELALTFVRVTTPLEAVTVVASRLKPGDVLVSIGPKEARSVGWQVEKALRSPENNHDNSVSHRSIALGPRVEPSSGRTLIDDFLIIACKYPGTIAAVCGSNELTYAQLAEEAHALAARLKGLGTETGDIIAVRLKRSVHRVVAFLGVLFARAAYLPIDPRLPQERVKFMMADAKVKMLIEEEGEINIPGVDSVSPAGYSEHASQLIELNSFPSPSDAAYIIYTSGTTGTPKGIVIEHAALYNVARASARTFDVGPSCRVSQISSYGFDIAVGEMAMALFAGATLIYPEDDMAQPGRPLGAYIRETKITHLSLTPSLLSTLPFGEYENLTHIIVCGERCLPNLAELWSKDFHFFNAYGPAEATVWCTFDEGYVGTPITIGKPIDNVSVVLLDDEQHNVPVETKGEIWVFGTCLARGYLNRDDVTCERFRFIEVQGETVRAYRTGDIAVMCSDGRIQFLGRADNQIKLRGFRIEPGEIEGALRHHPKIVEAAVRLQTDCEGADRLVAYLVTHEKVAVSARETSAYLAGWLPNYMIPTSNVQMESLPRTLNQKLDYRDLPNPFLTSKIYPSQQRKPNTATEVAIREIVNRELPSVAIDNVRDEFSNMGVDSLQTATIFASVERKFDIQLPVEAYANANTIELLAVYVDKENEIPTSQRPIDSFLIDTIVRKQLGHFAAWTGIKRTPTSLICAHNLGSTKPAIYWCFQGNREHEVFARALGSSQPIYGMRSGYLVFRYKEENVRVLADKYADEMIGLQPEGSFILGGNCQGGIIAHAIAQKLQRRGRAISLLCLLGATQFSAFDGRVALIFSEGSRRNSYTTTQDLGHLFRAAYGHSYSIYSMPGDDNSQFSEPNVHILAKIVSKIVEQSRHTD